MSIEIHEPSLPPTATELAARAELVHLRPDILANAELHAARLTPVETPVLKMTPEQVTNEIEKLCGRESEPRVAKVEPLTPQPVVESFRERVIKARQLPALPLGMEIPE